MKSFPYYILVGGPTASGKSEYALELCKKHQGEVINADSVQVYNCLKILTAQPQDYQGIAHHLYGEVSPYDSLNAALWCQMAVKKIQDCWMRKKVPIVVGGTGLYLQALTKGLSPIPVVPADIRKDVLKKQQSLSKEDFYDLLKSKDPKAALRLHPNDSQRLSRALEVMLSTNKSIVEWQEISTPFLREPFDYHVISLEKDLLHSRIHARVLKMLDLGVIEEVEAFISAVDVNKISATLRKTVGLEEIIEYLKGGLSKEALIELIALKTRQYAKRQQTWFQKVSKNTVLHNQALMNK
jgi:tRNA dimethylallyltransferase